jgi:energy-coupling factor transporter ATP-binding protein EcfA2
MANPITSIEFQNFKGFRHYSIQLKETSFLVGSNNCGKSTIISSFRILEAGLRKARSRNPERFIVSGEATRGYEITVDDLDVSTENVHTDYDAVESSISFKLSNGNILRLVFPANGGCFLIPESGKGVYASPKGFEKLYPLPLVVVPVLGPLEHDEQLVRPGTVQRNLSSSRASRNFRSYWVYHPDEFATFAELVASTWPGMSVLKPEPNGDSVQMYCLENRMTRELYWAGFGFQIWCQLLSHLSRAEEGSLVIIDEPEIYLHPDVQRQIPRIIDSLKLSSVIATHSTEIISQAEPSEIIPIDKKARSAKRLKEVKEIQLVLEQIGSVQNLLLSRLARHGRVLFFEGDDLRLLKRFAARIKLELGNESKISMIKAGGFQSWRRIRDLAWGLKKLNLKLRIGAIFDRDYFPEDELIEIKDSLKSEIEFVHILERKEIENYLLAPAVLHRAIQSQLCKKENEQTKCDLIWVETNLLKITEEFHYDALGQYVAKAIERSKGSRINPATTTSNVSKEFNEKWSVLDHRLWIVPGKEALRRFRQIVQESTGITLTDAVIAGAFQPAEIPADLVKLLITLQVFTLQEEMPLVAEM